MRRGFERFYCSALSTHKSIVLVVVFGLIGLSLWGAWGLGMDADFMALLDPSDKTVVSYKTALENFTGTDSFSLFIDNTDNQTLSPFLAQLLKLKDVDQVRVIPLGSASPAVDQQNSEAVLVLVKPFFRPTDFSQSRQLSKTIRSLAKQSGLSLGITGSYQVLIESADAINKDMYRAGLVTLVGILVLLLLVFRIPWVVGLCMAATLCVGLCWTLGLVRLTLGQLNLLTATLPAVILGLGVDFSLHMIYAFNEKASLLPVAESGLQCKPGTDFLAYVFSKIYKPLLIGALTTSVAFLSLCFAKSRGLFEMGLMGAMGIGCTFAAATVLLPILLSAVPVSTLAKIRRMGCADFNSSRLFSSKGQLFTILVLTVAAGSVGVARIRFSSDQNKLVDRNLPAFALQTKLQEEQSLSLVPIAFISPDAETEQDKLTFLQCLPDPPFGFMESYLLAQQQGDNPDRFAGVDASRLILAYPQNNAFDPIVFERIASVAKECHNQFSAPGNLVTGSPFLNAALNQIIKIDLFRCSFLAAVFVFMLVFYCFRTATRTVIAMLPVVLGTILMVGFMGSMNIDFTIMTIVIVPLVIGAGIDDGVHMLSRWHTENKDVPATLRNVATPIIGTTLTSMIAFGSLMLSNNPGLRQLGLVVMVGLGFCLLISLFILPQMLNLFERGKSR